LGLILKFLRRSHVLGAACAVLVLACLRTGVAYAATTATTTFTTPGGYSFTVPPGVTSIGVTAVGGHGGDCVPSGTFGGGRGAAVSATFAVSPGERLFVGVGGPGGNAVCGSGSAGGAGGVGGGGTGGDTPTGVAGNAAHPAGGGGGASLVGVASPSPGFPGLMVVAGGGAGGNGYAPGGDSGAEGGGNFNCFDCGKGQPGTLSAGGAGGHVSGTPGADGAAGSFGIGGNGSDCPPIYAPDCTGGGGGGGGYYGGGGGGSVTAAGGGGGGSSFVAAGAASVSMGLSSASSAVSLTYAAPTADESATTLHFGTQAPGTAGPAQRLTITNKGSAPLIVSGILLGGADPGDFLVGNRCQQPVPVGSSCQVGIRFHPQATGGRSASLTLLTNAATAPTPVSLSGGVAAASRGPAGKVELLTCKAPASHAFDVVAHPAATAPEKCKGKLVRGTFQFTAGGSSTRAKIVRGRTVFATGASVTTAHGDTMLVLTERRALRRGTYTLILRHRRHGHWHTRSVAIFVR
jgi:Glycine rich protein